MILIYTYIHIYIYIYIYIYIRTYTYIYIYIAFSYFSTGPWPARTPRSRAGGRCSRPGSPLALFNKQKKNIIK